MRFVRSYANYWLGPAPLFNLAFCRIIIVAYQLGHIFAWNYHAALITASQKPDFLYQPILAVKLTTGVLGLSSRPTADTLIMVLEITVVFGVLALVGLLTNLTLIIFAMGNLLLQGYMYSFGEWHHPDALLMIMLVLLALSPSGRKLSLDALAPRFIGKSAGGHWLRSIREESWYARWPLLLMQWLLALAYLSAGLHKARYGLDWVNGYTLQYWMLSDAIRQGIAAGLWLGRFHVVVQGLSVVSLIFELGFWLVLLRRRLGLVFVPAGVAIHLGIYLTMGAEFFQYIALYAVFVPWSRVVETLRGLVFEPRVWSLAGTRPKTDRRARRLLGVWPSPRG